MKYKLLFYLNPTSKITQLKIYFTLFIFFGFTACKKLVTIPLPVNSITTSSVFSTDAQANTALAGIYANLIEKPSFADGYSTFYLGMSADELLYFYGSQGLNQYQFNTNAILSSNGDLLNYFWTQPYFSIYQANATIAGLAASTGVDQQTKNELTGEALFVRAYCYFYLTNLFGDVPLVLTTDYNKTSLLARTPSTQVYQQIINDLKTAQNLLETDYSYSIAEGERIIPNKWAATALLARAYLYIGDYPNAYIQSNAVIENSGEYSLVPNLAGVFNTNSTEAIWQLKQNLQATTANITYDGDFFIPANSNRNPTYYIASGLINSFEVGDKRRTVWIDSTNYFGMVYYIPYKYTLGPAQSSHVGTITQYYMMLRLAEQYLIKAEAEANNAGPGISAAVNDLNSIRTRAGLPNYSGALDKTSLMNAIMHERQVEFFCEQGHRWLDLKRWGNAASELSQSKGISVTTNSLLYPIPMSEITTDPKLTQNKGYQ